jgi:hypothetical protein
LAAVYAKVSNLRSDAKVNYRKGIAVFVHTKSGLIVDMVFGRNKPKKPLMLDVIVCYKITPSNSLDQ